MALRIERTAHSTEAEPDFCEVADAVKWPWLLLHVDANVKEECRAGQRDLAKRPVVRETGSDRSDGVAGAGAPGSGEEEVEAACRGLGM